MKTTVKIAWIFFYICFGAKAQTPNNEFKIGMFGIGAIHFDNTAQTPCPHPTGVKVSGGNNTSVLNILSEDGFNIFKSYEPNEWTNEETVKGMIDCAAANGVQIFFGLSNYYEPQGCYHGTNNFGNCGTAAPCSSSYILPSFRPNYNHYLNIYTSSSYKNTVWGYQMTEEASWGHWMSMSCGANNIPQSLPSPAICQIASGFQFVEVPPANVQSAITYVKSATNGTNHKIAVMEALHQGVISPNALDGEQVQNPPGYWFPQDYFPLLNIDDTRDVIFEGSYFVSEPNWTSANYGLAMSGQGPHHLGKFPSIDFAKQYSRHVHSVIANYLRPGETLNRHLHGTYTSNGVIPNANWLWFQAYTSVIHDVDGIWFYDVNSFDAESEQEKITNFYNPSSPGRFNSRSNFPSVYEEYVSNLARELRYLVNKDIISTDHSNVLFKKTNNADPNCIVPPAGGNSYILQALPAGLSTAAKNELNTENYGLRYTIRTNGTDVYMIVSNPLGAAVSVNLDFSGIGNPIISNATGAEVLFESSQNVSSSTYKINRNSNINFSTMNVGVKHSISMATNHQLPLQLGPYDVKVLKFSSVVPNHNNGWDLAWTNKGTGWAGGYKFQNNDLVYHADLDGDGTDEMLCVQYTPNFSGDWMTLLKFDPIAQDWAQLWSNYGNGGALYPYRYNFIVGDFDGDGHEELLGNDNGGPGGWTTLFKWQNNAWVWAWSDGGPAGGHPISPYKEKMYAGDFDGDGKDELLACDIPSPGYTTEFRWNSSLNDFVIGTWSDYGSPHALTAYRDNLYPGDYDGDGHIDLLGFTSSNVELFEYVNFDWVSTWSSNGPSFGGWSFPLSSTDRALVGNIDSDSKDEFIIIQTGAGAAWATSYDFGSSGLSWNWSANPGAPSGPFIDDWPLDPGNATANRYYITKPVATDPHYIMTMRNPGCKYIVNMYKTNSSTSNYRHAATATSISSESLGNSTLIYPNPANEELYIENTSGNSIRNVLVTDLQGKVIVQIDGISGAATRINVSEIPAGMYFVKVQTDSDFSVHKTVIN